MADSPKERLHNLLTLFTEERISAEHFSSAFETIYNLELDKSSLDPMEASTFAKLFDKVVWYSPLAEERKQVPNYLGEDEIKSAAHEAHRTLAKGG